EPVCPFCLGREKDEEELYRVGGQKGDAGWQIRVLPNKFPFAPVHEVIVHSPDHHKSFDELPMSQTQLILQTYRQRFQTHQSQGQVYIFHNHGEGGGESLPHPHTQLVVIPNDVKMDLPRLDPSAYSGIGPSPLDESTSQSQPQEQPKVETMHFYLFCPRTSQWPDEVWIAPKTRGRNFAEITDGEISDLSQTLVRLIHILDLRHGHEFPYNFYIYPGGDWYLRLIPRQKALGGFEIGTGIFVNTQDPLDAIRFIKEHFEHPDDEKIKRENQADYSRSV
ncbi:MAG TPA: hypothetical protein VLF68_02475, partial [Candidatus Saccharimonadales bacterium]|nr:hypothetical protein [Candidatus Saccharimonadales bacterium]